MNKVLVVVGHPCWDKSKANRAIVDEIVRIGKEKGENDSEYSVEVSNITELYPDGNIDVAAEQKKLLHANVVVFDFPIMWFAAPSPIHRYMEDVLAYGWAYGPEGTVLRNKSMVASVTAGGTEEFFSGSKSVITMDGIIAPLAAVANFCLMHWEGYVCTYDADNRNEEVYKNHARRVMEIVRGLA